MVVVDTSVVYKWFNSEEENIDQALKILEDHLRKQILITIPDIALYELANVLATKTTLTVKESVTTLKQLKKYNLNVLTANLTLLEKVIKLSKKHHTTVYDASYIVLAKEKRCDFITADSKLVSKVKLPFVKLLKDYGGSQS